jgi:hypothetical protein
MNSRASRAVQRAFYFLSPGVTNLANVMNAGLVLLGSAIIDAWPEGMETIRHIVTRRVYPVIRDRPVTSHCVASSLFVRILCEDALWLP